MTLAPTMGYCEKRRMYFLYEIVILENGESFIGDIILELGVQYGKARRQFFKYTGL